MATKVEELEAVLEAAREEQKQADREQRARQSKAWAELYADPTAWEWTSYPQKQQKFFAEEDDRNGTRVMRKLNAERLAEWKLGGPAMFSSDHEDGHERGMFYYRTDEGILTQSGGGWHVLKVPRLCSDIEWGCILTGDIPEKFKK